MNNIIITRDNYEDYICSDDPALRAEAEAIEDEIIEEEWEKEF